MAGSTYGNIFKITTWGESHGKGIGVVIDGCPAGLSLSEEDIQQFLNRRKPGQSKYTTKRMETDTVEILSEYLRDKQQALLFHFLSGMKTSIQKITEILRPATVRGMQTILLMQNMVSAITEAEDVPQAEKLSDVLQEGLSL